jgi:hypothetical protein
MNLGSIAVFILAYFVKVVMFGILKVVSKMTGKGESTV